MVLCSHIPPTEDPIENYQFIGESRSVGHVIKVLCYDKTVAVLKCLSDGKWNGTAPACPQAVVEHDEGVGPILIIVWVVGGILLFSLIILITIIITSSSKTNCVRRSARERAASVFHISGRGTRREGGDNPAFTRADEQHCGGEWTFERHGAMRAPRPAGVERSESTRLPTYQEAILNQLITVPAASGPSNQNEPPVFVRANAPPSYRSSQLQSAARRSSSNQNSAPSSNSQSNPSGAAAESESSNQTSREAESRQPMNRISEGDESRTTTSGRSNTLPGRRSTRVSSPQHSNTQERSTTQGSTSNENGDRNSRRFAQDYPQCYFEEEPPPPYPSGNHDNGSNRRRSPSRRSQRSQGGTYQGRNGQRARSPHPIAAGRTGVRSNQIETRVQVECTAQTRASPRPRIDPVITIDLNSENEVSSIPRPGSSNGTGITGSRNSSNCARAGSFSGSGSENVYSSGSTARASSRSIPSNYRHGQDSPTSQLLPNQVPQSVPSSYTTMPPSVASSSSRVPTNYSQNQRQADSSNNREPISRADTLASNQGPLYIIRSSQATPSAPPISSYYSHPTSQSEALSLPSSPRLPHEEIPPLGTSTPITQSPAPVRRFGNQIIATPPSNVPQHSRSASVQDGHSTYNVHPIEYCGRGLFQPSNQLQPRTRPTHVIHNRHDSAPIASFDSDFY